MSMEDAINNHALALKDLAAAIRSMGTSMVLAGPDDETVHHQRDFGTKADQGGAANALSTIAAATPQEILAAVDGKASAADTKKQKDAEMEKAVAKVEADAKKPAAAETSAETSPANTAALPDKTDEAAPLDYVKDIRPTLLQVVKGGRRPDVEAFLASAGVKKADELPAEKLPALQALANKLIGEIEAAKAAA